MIIFTNENNTSALKLLICAKLSKKNVEIRVVKPTDKSVDQKKVVYPFLQVNEDVSFISSNAASLYLLPLHDGNRDSLKWLEWEATKLTPTLANIPRQKFTNDSEFYNSRLGSLITELNIVLEKKEFLVENKLTVVDVCLWSSLYGIVKNEMYKRLFADASNITRWHANVARVAEKEIADALKECPVQMTEVFAALDGGALGRGYQLPGTASQTANTATGPSSSISPEVKQEVAVTEEELKTAADHWVNGHEKLGKLLPDEKIVLPKEGFKNILITSALPYVNNVPHLGNIIGCVLSADVFARYCRLCSYNALFICGTDEYGTATETKALEEGLTPRQICDKYFEIHNSVYRWFGIGFDYFGRTTTPEQTEIAQKMFLDLYKNGFVNTETVDQLLCEKCNRFLADRFVEGTCPHPGCGYEDARGDQCDGCGKLVNATELISARCKLCSSPPVIRNSAHFFLDLPSLEPLLLSWVTGSEQGWSNSAKMITRAWLKLGLRPRCITRDLSWGVPVPIQEYKEKVFYVWFDAPIGYISITKRYTDQYERWWKPDPKHNVTLYQFMAKDNVPFHSVVFPATLLGVGQKHIMVKHIMATEYLNYEDGKFSKSRGVGIFGSDAQDTGIPADVFRFYLLSIRPEGQDSNFSWLDLATRNNSELLNNLGNFVNRAAVFCANSFSGKIPEMLVDGLDMNLIALVNREIKGYVESLEESKQRDGLRHVLNISRLGNQYMQSQQPWVLLKGTDDAKLRAGTVVGLSCNLSALLGILLAPYMPSTARTLLAQLGTTLEAVGHINPSHPCMRRLLPAGHKIGSPSPLFSKIEAARVEELKKKYAGKQEATPPRDVKPAANLTAQELENKIQQQGEKVRQLKTSGAEKAVWQPEVEILLALKKQLTAAQAQKQDGRKTAQQLEADITAQGEKVRKLKTGGAEKAVWQPEVDILLALKKQLTATQVQKQDGGKTSAQVEAEIATQGEKVRQLKTGGADKTVWQPEVAILLALKKQLADLQIKDGSAPAVEQNQAADKKKNQESKGKKAAKNAK